MLTVSIAVLLLQAGTPSPTALDLPSGSRLGVAWAKDLLTEARRERIAAQAPALLPSAELAWLGRWPQEAQARADELSVDHVVLVRAAKTAKGDTVTHEYGDGSGQTARVRFTGAESEIELQFLRRGKGWEVRGEKSSSKSAQAPWTVKAAAESKADLVVDPEDQLAQLLAQGLDEGAGFLAGAALWERRDLLRARSASLEDGDSHALWDLAREVVPRAPAHAPRATLARAAAADWGSWQKRIQERTAETVAAGACGWCTTPVPAGASCACPSAVALSRLIEFSAGVLEHANWDPKGPSPDSPKPAPNPARNLRGDRPRDVLARVAELQRALEERPALDAREALARFKAEQTFWLEEGIQVLVVGDALGDDLILGLDPDFARPALELVQRRKESGRSAFDSWGVHEDFPFAVLIERDKEGKRKPKQLGSFEGKKLDSAALQGLLEQALWARYRTR